MGDNIVESDGREFEGLQKRSPETVVPYDTYCMYLWPHSRQLD